MFKNRSIQVKLAKDNQSDAGSGSQTTPAEYAAIAREVGKDAVKGAAILVGTYVAADTLRQVIVLNSKFRKN